jgi:2-amino-4-hydroxy-6-hydroxymethyldihydropteridine diphosphokinase
MMNDQRLNNKRRVLLSLGSNIGDKNTYIRKAIRYIEKSGFLSDILISSFYQTEPFGIKEQEWFLNAAISGDCDVSPKELFELIKGIELMLGRKSRQKWHEREIDIDILIFGECLIESEELTIPHKGLALRKFVLVPSAEIEPDLVNPSDGRTIRSLLDSCPDDSKVVIQQPVD